MAASCLLSEDQFLCSICLDVFTDPVSTPCGHNFCKNCITEHWKVNVPKCPLCNNVFDVRPQLKINTFISEVVAQFKQKADSSSSEQEAAKPGEVPCDRCTGTKLKALKSCPMCLESYCETHLKPHLTVLNLKRHHLIDPVDNLEDRMCTKHNKLLKLFCRTDQTCVCMLCINLEHRIHDVVPLKEEYEGQKADLRETEAEIHQMIQKRRLKIEEIKQTVILSKQAAARETAEGVQVFTALMESVQKGLDKLKEDIEEKQRRTERQAENFIKELEQEISELKKRSTEVEHLSRSEDHLHFLLQFTAIKAAPTMKTWTDASIRPPSYEETVKRTVTQLEDKLREVKTKLLQAELKRLQQFAVDVTLDPDTANPELILSEDGKQVCHGDFCKVLQNNTKRFTSSCAVLGKSRFSSGRFYFEVEVKGKVEWLVGVVTESINRDKSSFQPGKVNLLYKDGSQYSTFADNSVCLCLKSCPQKVGVFVDFEEGLVSFYDVDSVDLIYSFGGCCFTENIFPYFNPCTNEGGKNSVPLIITPVRLTE